MAATTLDVPRAVADLALGEVSASTVALVWSAVDGDPRVPVTRYRARFSVNGVAHKEVTTTSPGLTLGSNAPGNEPLPRGASVTNIIVHAINSVGPSSPSSPLSTTTLDVPGRVRDLGLGGVTATTVRS
eukprot:CAMPEP_0114546230 /NCGR_PEP_ID=MMETSP0114-20121206/3824_1 /TAXON_ID=31324 /ORGANISM="Goniomonas sp, Strain m" /LENGTH=128 /DNA_ID=CAMNT_0001730713 /DNA_START=84 /DNA_END=470 /DNA_ORIENTATION=+